MAFARPLFVAGRRDSRVMIVPRSATREELEDPVHGTLKRLMKEEINKILGKSYIIDIIISDYQIREL